MSATCSSPSCESRRRDTASYSYSPCCALVVDFMCHCTSGRPIARAISLASIVLPVPGSPFTSSGRSSVTAALTARIRSQMVSSLPTFARHLVAEDAGSDSQQAAADHRQPQRHRVEGDDGDGGDREDKNRDAVAKERNQHRDKT